MSGEVRILSTLEGQTQARELIRVITEKEDHGVLTVDVRSLKGLVELMRDYAVITHASDPQTEVATAVGKLIDFVGLNTVSDIRSTEPSNYKTTDLAKVFGVSVTAINNWIEEGRFINYQREPNKHARIPHITPFQHRDGRVEPLGLIVERYKRQESPSFADNDEKALLFVEIGLLQQKYGGKELEDAFDFENLTSEQERDFSRWRFYRARLEKFS